MDDGLLPVELGTVDSESTVDRELSLSAPDEASGTGDFLCILGQCDRRGVRSFWRPRWLVNTATMRQAWLLPGGWKALAAARGVLLAAMVVMFAVLVAGESGPGFLRTYSYCTFLLELVCCGLLFAATLFPHRWLCAAAAILLQASVGHALTVTLAFWGLIARPNNWTQVRMYLVHGANFLVLLLEVAALDRIVFVPMQGCIVNLAFDVLYFLCVLLPVQLYTGVPIYQNLTDFSRPGVFIAVAIGIPVLNLIFFFGFMLLSFAKAKCASSHGSLPLRLFVRKETSDAIAMT